tara:strand:+ start:4440 stop:4769 length:330 start_codon:yes stop_codon:yes gene_type:complete
MPIREEKKLAKKQKLTRKEKDDLRRKKLKEVRKGKGAGRPFQMRKKTADTFRNPQTQEMLSERRERELARVSAELKDRGLSATQAKKYGIVAPSKCKFRDNEKTDKAGK